MKKMTYKIFSFHPVATDYPDWDAEASLPALEWKSLFRQLLILDQWLPTLQGMCSFGARVCNLDNNN